jgi:hypothetical protein
MSDDFMPLDSTMVLTHNSRYVRKLPVSQIVRSWHGERFAKGFQYFSGCFGVLGAPGVDLVFQVRIGRSFAGWLVGCHGFLHRDSVILVVIEQSDEDGIIRRRQLSRLATDRGCEMCVV